MIPFAAAEAAAEEMDLEKGYLSAETWQEEDYRMSEKQLQNKKQHENQQNVKSEQCERENMRKK